MFTPHAAMLSLFVSVDNRWTFLSNIPLLLLPFLPGPMWPKCQNVISYSTKPVKNKWEQDCSAQGTKCFYMCPAVALSPCFHCWLQVQSGACPHVTQQLAAFWQSNQEHWQQQLQPHLKRDYSPESDKPTIKPCVTCSSVSPLFLWYWGSIFHGLFLCFAAGLDRKTPEK